MNSERKSFAAFALTAALLFSSLPALVAAPLASASTLTPGRASHAHLSSIRPNTTGGTLFVQTPTNKPSATAAKGDQVVVSATVGFSPTGVVAVTLVQGASQPITVATAPVNSAGGFLASFIVPVTFATGVVTITATDNNNPVAASQALFSIPSVTVSPGQNSGPKGSTVSVNAANLASNAAPVTVTFDITGSAPITVATTTADSSGTANTTFVVPATATTPITGSLPVAGVITVTDRFGNAASAGFTITVPSLSANPSQGGSGTITTLTGGGFAPTGPVTITSRSFSGSAGPTVVVTPTGGAFTAPYTIPINTAQGVDVITATDSFSNVQVTNFTVATSLFVNPTSGISPTTVAVTGTGFIVNTPNIVVQLVAPLTGVPGGAVTSTQFVTSDVSGAITATFVVTGTAPGTATFSASDQSGNAASASFNIVTVASPTPTGSPSATPSSTNTSTVVPTSSITTTQTAIAGATQTASAAPTNTSTAVPTSSITTTQTAIAGATQTQAALPTSTATAPPIPTSSVAQINLVPANGSACATAAGSVGVVASQSVDVNLTGFTAGEVVSVTVGTTAGISSTIVVTADSAGRSVFTTNFSSAQLKVAPLTVTAKGLTSLRTVTTTVISCPSAAGVSPTNPLIGTTFVVTGTGFTPGETVTITEFATSTSLLATVPAGGLNAAQFTVGPNGAFSQNLTASSTVGTFNVRIQGLSSGLVFTPTITVVTPPTQAGTGNLVLAPSTGSACTTVTGTASAVVNQPISAVATGFKAQELVNFLVAGLVVSQVTADANGNAIAIITPTINNLGGITTAGALAGVSQTVSAVGTTSGNVGSAVLQGCATTLTVSSPTGNAGSTVQTVTGSGFGSGEVVSVTYYLASATTPVTFGASAPGVTLAFTATASTQGRFTGTITTPVSFGNYIFRGVGVTTGLIATTAVSSTPTGLQSLTGPVFPCQPFVIGATGGFSPTEVITITGGVAPVTATVAISGGFNATLIAPANTPVGNLVLTVTSANRGVVTVNQPITVPTAVLSSSAGTVNFGSSVVITGSGYIPSQGVTLTTEFATPGGTIVPNIGNVTTVTATAAGTFSSTYTVSPTVSILNGGYQVRGTSSCSTQNTATTPISVTPSTLPGAGAVGGLPGATAFPSTTIYFAEGYTGRFATNHRADFDEFISVLNPDNFTKTVTFTYQLQGSSTPVVTTTQIGPNTDILRLVNTDVGNDQIVSAIVSSPNRIAAERIINRTAPSGKLDADSSLGNTSAGNTWYFAEGYTGASFQEYLTVQNPFSATATITVTFLPQSTPATTTQQETFTIPGNSRATRNIRADYLPYTLAGSGKSVGLKVTSDQQIVAERVMYWGDGAGSGKYGASTKAGATGAAKSFTFAYGSAPGAVAGNVGPAQMMNDESFVTVINPNPASLSDAVVLVSFFDAAGNPVGSKSITVSPQTRETIAVNSVINAGAPVNGPYYTTVSSDQPIFVEKPQYIGGSPNMGTHPGLSPSGTVGGVTSVLFPNVNTGTASGSAISETVFLVNTSAAPISVSGTYYTPSGAAVTKSYSVASSQLIVVNVNADAGGLPVGPLGAQYTSSGQFVAARVSSSPDLTSFIGNQGVVNQ